MCGRFTLKTPSSTIGSLFPELDYPELKPRFNIAPTQPVACVRNNLQNDKELVFLRWGLVPFWSKDLKIGVKMINARSETVVSKPAFRAAFKKRRCVVIADGYYEWRKIGNEKQPYYITTPDHDGAFCMAGMWESWTDKSNGDQVETCTVLTTDSNPKLASIHDRMPVILNHDQREFWLDRDFSNVDRLQAMLQPTNETFFEFNPVNKIVNNARNESPDCVQVVELD